MKCPFRVLLFTLMLSGATIFCGTSICSAIPVLQDANDAAETPEEEKTPYAIDYECYQNATKETDILKRGQMLLGCIENHKTPTLMPNYEAAYSNLMFETHNDGKNKELLEMAENASG